MTAVAWPPSLPQAFLIAGHTETPLDNTIREPMDVGPPISRRRTSLDVYQVTVQSKMTPEQRRIFRAFYRDDLRNGTVPFRMLDSDDIARDFYIAGPPSYTNDAPNWLITLVLEYTDVA